MTVPGDRVEGWCEYAWHSGTVEKLAGRDKMFIVVLFDEPIPARMVSGKGAIEAAWLRPNEVRPIPA